MNIKLREGAIVSFRNNYLALALILLSSFHASAQWVKPNNSFGTIQNGIKLERIILYPTGCGAPTPLIAADSAKKTSALYFDSCGHNLYTYDPSVHAWILVMGGGGSGTRVDSLTLVDSVLCIWQAGTSLCANLRSTKVYVKDDLTVDETTNPGFQTLGRRHDDGLDANTGIVTSAGCLILHVTPASYYLKNGTHFFSRAIDLTVPTPDASLPRHDRIVADTLGNVFIIPGTPATLPQDPPYNPASQWSIATYPVAAGATCLSITSKIIYDETGGTEYTPSTSGTITASASNTDNPEHLTIALYVQSYADSAQVIFTKPSGQDTVFNNSLFRWGQYLNNPFQGHQLQMQLFLAGVSVTSNIVVNPYISVFDTLEYQTVAVPWYAFGASGNIIYDKVVFTLRGSDLSGASGLFFDYFQLQTGITNSTPSLYLTTDSTSGPATLVGNHLNVPNYASGGGGSETMQQTFENSVAAGDSTAIDLTGHRFRINEFLNIFPSSFGTSLNATDGASANAGIQLNADTANNLVTIQIRADKNTDVEGEAQISLDGMASTIVFQADSGSVFSQGIVKILDVPNGASTDSVLTINPDTRVINMRDAASFGGGGTITNIATGYGLTGGPITTTGTIAVDTTALSLKYLRIVDTTNKWVNNVTYLNDSTITIWKGSTSTTVRTGPGSGGGTTQVTADSTLVATGGQTAFTFTAVPGAYTDYIIFVNGASIEPVTYFTTSSNTITFSIGLVVGDRVRYKRIK